MLKTYSGVCLKHTEGYAFYILSFGSLFIDIHKWIKENNLSNKIHTGIKYALRKTKAARVKS
jgi:hypothetical protein